MDSYLTEKTHHLQNELKMLQKLDIHYAKTMAIIIFCCIIHGWIGIIACYISCKVCNQAGSCGQFYNSNYNILLYLHGWIGISMLY